MCVESGITFHYYKGPLINGQNTPLKRSNGSEMVTKILRPCLGKLLDFVNSMIFSR